MVRECPDAEIHSFEHHKEWFDKAVEEFGSNEYVHLWHVPIVANHHCHYVTNALKLARGDEFHANDGKTYQFSADHFDVVFIDGRRRMECCMVAAMVVRGTGYVLLHDAERPEYVLRHLALRECSLQYRTSVMRAV
jgi:hypothetical protein